MDVEVEEDAFMFVMIRQIYPGRRNVFYARDFPAVSSEGVGGSDMIPSVHATMFCAQYVRREMIDGTLACNGFDMEAVGE